MIGVIKDFKGAGTPKVCGIFVMKELGGRHGKCLQKHEVDNLKNFGWDERLPAGKKSLTMSN